MTSHIFPLPLSDSIHGFDLAAAARRLSPRTLADYHNTFRKFQAFLEDDPLLDDITPRQVREFLSSQTVSKKTLLNYHTGLSALWSWAVAESYASTHILHLVERPQPEKRAIVPYSESDLKAMLASLDKSSTYSRPGKRPASNSLFTADRNRAIILLLLDTGIRASELCDLTINNVDLRNRRIKVFGKGAKERSIPFSPRTGASVFRYLSAQRKDSLAGDPLFVTDADKPLDRSVLRQLLQRIGRRAAVKGVTVHRFRHTFAILYLRNGGDPWSLQLILGHTTLDMVHTYLALAQSDLDKHHRQASPVANLNL